MCDIINGKLSEHLCEKLNGQSLNIETLQIADNELLEYFNENILEKEAENKLKGMAIVKACSEALYFASAACLDNKEC